MTTLFLVRHAAHPSIDDVLAGRMPGVILDGYGHAQARRLAARLADESITAVQSSPCERALQTAAPIAACAGVPLEIVPALDEIDLGAWSGQPFFALANDPQWKLWNTARSRTRPPGGESMPELQQRMLGHLRSVHAEIPDGNVVMVSHAEPIRAAALHALSLPLDDFGRVEIAPASITTMIVNAGGCRLAAVNEAVAA